jgi:hypothetical protein
MNWSDLEKIRNRLTENGRSERHYAVMRPAAYRYTKNIGMPRRVSRKPVAVRKGRRG